MRRLIRALLVAVLAAAMSPVVASAAPPASFVVTFDCSDGNSFDINFGAPPNAGSTGFVVGDNSVLVAKSFTAAFDGSVIEEISWVRGLQGFDQDQLTTCTGSVGPFAFTLTGWLTPRG
jgi:hypothetical protein